MDNWRRLTAAAKFYRVSPRTLRRWVKTGQLRSTKFTSIVYVSDQQCADLVAERRAAGRLA